MEIKEMIKVMQHFADGGNVEYKTRKDTETLWTQVTSPSWDWAYFDYRIKKENKLTIKKWLIKDTNTGEHFMLESSDVDLTLKDFPNWKKIKLMEYYKIEL